MRVCVKLYDTKWYSKIQNVNTQCHGSRRGPLVGRTNYVLLLLLLLATTSIVVVFMVDIVLLHVSKRFHRCVF